jgi:pimeloyl-ACP methyl ester carboxylesterase
MEEEITNIGDSLPDWFGRAMQVSREDLTININGTDIKYFRWGNPDKPPVIFSHGFLSHRRCWAFIAPLLAEKYNLFAFDLSGMGDSGTAPAYDLDNRIEEISTFVEKLNLKQKPVLVGHSFGGGLYIHLLQQNPELARAVVACDTFMLRPQDVSAWIASSQMQRSAPPTQRKIYPDWETIYGRFVLSPPQPVACPFLFEYMAKHSVKQIDEGWTWKFDPAIIQRNEKERFWWSENADVFCNIKIPKAIIYGKNSALVQNPILDYLKEKSKTSFNAIGIDDAHHHIMLDKPLELASAIDTTLSQL